MATAGGKRAGAGRKKGFAALEAERQRDFVAKKLVKEFAPIVDKAISQAKDGDKYAREWLADRAYGKSMQAVEMSGKDGEDVPFPIMVITNALYTDNGDK